MTFAINESYAGWMRLPLSAALSTRTPIPAGAWNRLMAELEEAAPAYILVNDQALESMVVHHYPALATEVSALPSRLGRRYQKFRTDAGGTWYLRLDLAREQSGT